MKILTIKNTGKIILFLIFTTSVYSQELSVGADIVNRYIWRGSDLGENSPSIQPAVAFSASGFTTGFWGAFPTANPAALNEIDFYASQTFSFNNSGSISLGFTDYMNPNSGTKIGNIHNHNDEEGPGAHFLEANLIYSGPDNLPLYLSFNIFFYNVENNPIYFEAGYSTSISDIAFDVFLGGSPGEDTGYYSVKDFGIINTGIKATKEIKFSESFSLPVFGSIILNPASENLFFVAGISL